MLFRKSLHINNSIRSSLAEIGLSEFQDFTNFSAGKLLSRPSKRPVRVLSLNVAGQERKYFLKQSWAQSLRAVLKAWRRLQTDGAESTDGEPSDDDKTADSGPINVNPRTADS